jgi:hypothetical protein
LVFPEVVADIQLLVESHREVVDCMPRAGLEVVALFRNPLREVVDKVGNFHRVLGIQDAETVEKIEAVVVAAGK